MATVLVVDSNRNQRLLYEQELGEEGYRVVLAEDGCQAVAKLDVHTPDVAIVEVWCRKLGGLNLLECLQRYRRNTPIIVNTTRVDYRDLVAGLVDAYVVKSSNLHSLKMAIRELLRQRTPVSRIGRPSCGWAR